MVEQKYKQNFEQMGPYTNPLWNQTSVVDDCILVDNWLAVQKHLWKAVLKRLHRSHPGDEAESDVSTYLWWLHMHKNIVNIAEESKECTKYGKKFNYLILKNALKPLPLLTQPESATELD